MTVEESVDPMALVEKYKKEVVEEITAGFGKELLGSITGYFPTGTRKALCDKYQNEAQHAYMTKAYDVALDRFCHYLAIIETDPSTPNASEQRATLTANVGACLYALDEPSTALTVLEKATDEFERLPFSLISKLTALPVWLFYGDLKQNRVDYINARIADIKAGKKADSTIYQDGYGKERKWSPEDQDGKNASWSFFNPMSWFGYGQLQDVSIEAPRATPVAEAI